MTEHPSPPAGLATDPHLSTEVLGDLLDGRLPADEQARARAHLDRCASCRGERDALAQVIGLGAHIRSLVSVPADVWPLVAAGTIHERAVRRHVLRSVRGPLIAAALLLAVVSASLGVLLGRELAARRERVDPVIRAEQGRIRAEEQRIRAEQKLLDERQRRLQQQEAAGEQPAGAERRRP